jgi:hypothetical protein
MQFIMGLLMNSINVIVGLGSFGGWNCFVNELVNGTLRKSVILGRFTNHFELGI